MQEPPPPESIASMWPLLVSAAEDGLRRAMYKSAEQWRIRREGQRIRQGVYDFFHNANQEVGSTVEEYEAVIIDRANVTGDTSRSSISSTAEIQAAVDSLVSDGYMRMLPNQGDGLRRFIIIRFPGPAYLTAHDDRP